MKKTPTFNKTAALLGVMLTACGGDALYTGLDGDGGPESDLGSDADTGDSDAGADNGEISLEARYQYDPPPNMGADRANLEGVTPQDIMTLANWVRDNADAILEIDLKTIDPEDPDLDATRVCDEVELFGDQNNQYVRCIIKEMLPQGPALSNDSTFTHDRVGFSSNTSLDLLGNSTGPAIYKDRISQCFGGDTCTSSFFLGEEHAARTGELRRWWRVRVAGRK